MRPRGGAAVRAVAMAANLTQTLKAFKERGVFVLGLDGEGDVPLPGLTWAREPLVVVVGSEGKGLSRLVTETCDADRACAGRPSLHTHTHTHTHSPVPAHAPPDPPRLTAKDQRLDRGGPRFCDSKSCAGACRRACVRGCVRGWILIVVGRDVFGERVGATYCQRPALRPSRTAGLWQ
ncbi:MAG: hypothetical protein RI885_324 [Actinomycetota bacterium]